MLKESAKSGYTYLTNFLMTAVIQDIRNNNNELMSLKLKYMNIQR